MTQEEIEALREMVYDACRTPINNMSCFVCNHCTVFIKSMECYVIFIITVCLMHEEAFALNLDHWENNRRLNYDR